jgi:thymidylate synthase (FAD)
VNVPAPELTSKPLSREITLITEPTVILIAEMKILSEGLNALYDWVGRYRPECLPDGDDGLENRGELLFPHRDAVTDNERLAELAGRNCYHSYGKKAGRKSNAEYIAHTQQGAIPHRSILYHAKMTFFIAGVSRRMTHELIRHYVGADREEEGSPSQESSRYTYHPGHFVVPPAMIAQGKESVAFYRASVEQSYNRYCTYIQKTTDAHRERTGKEPVGLDRKRIYEAATGLVPRSVATSLLWTTNPVALRKLFHEREDESSDLEFQRLVGKWKPLATERYKGFF